MKVSEVITLARTWLDDEVEPYKWTTTELVLYYNDAVNKVATEADYWLDPTTAATIKIDCVDGTASYPFNDIILRIDSARIYGQENYLTKISAREAELIWGENWTTDEDVPQYYCLDYVQGSITLIPVPDLSTYDIYLTVSRAPIAAVTTSTMAATDVPTAGLFHARMADAICMRAYLKAGAATFKPDVAAIHKGLFDSMIVDIKRYLIKLMHRQRAVRPRYGNI